MCEMVHVHDGIYDMIVTQREDNSNATPEHFNSTHLQQSYF